MNRNRENKKTITLFNENFFCISIGFEGMERCFKRLWENVKQTLFKYAMCPYSSLLHTDYTIHFIRWPGAGCSELHYSLKVYRGDELVRPLALMYSQEGCQKPHLFPSY